MTRHHRPSTEDDYTHWLTTGKPPQGEPETITTRPPAGFNWAADGEPAIDTKTDDVEPDAAQDGSEWPPPQPYQGVSDAHQTGFEVGCALAPWSDCPGLPPHTHKPGRAQ